LDSHPDLFNALAEKYYLEYVDQVDQPEIDILLTHLTETNTKDIFEQIRERALLPTFDDDADLGEAHGPDQEMHVSVDQAELQLAFDEARKSADRTVKGVWDAWFRSLQAVSEPGSETSPIVFKCADYGPSARAIAEHLDDRKILFIIRNPVFTFSSLRKLRSRQDGRHEFTTLRLIEEISNYRTFHKIRTMLTDRENLPTHTIRFEDLIREPEQVIEGVAEFFQVPYHKIMTQPTFQGDGWRGNSSYDSYEGISMAPLDPDRINLTDEEREMIDRSLGDVLAAYDYETYPSPP
jgi:hypothetical protein